MVVLWDFGALKERNGEWHAKMVALGEGHGFHAAVNSQFPQDILHVVSHRCGTDEPQGSRHIRSHARSHTLQYNEFLTAQAEQRRFLLGYHRRENC